MDPVFGHPPARCLRQRGDTAIAVAPVLGRQGNDGAAFVVASSPALPIQADPLKQPASKPAGQASDLPAEMDFPDGFSEVLSGRMPGRP
jgi:hypothetical protein